MDLYSRFIVFLQDIEEHDLVYQLEPKCYCFLIKYTSVDTSSQINPIFLLYEHVLNIRDIRYYHI
jgi:hypothetical protein